MPFTWHVTFFFLYSQWQALVGSCQSFSFLSTKPWMPILFLLLRRLRFLSYILSFLCIDTLNLRICLRLFSFVYIFTHNHRHIFTFCKHSYRRVFFGLSRTDRSINTAVDSHTYECKYFMATDSSVQQINWRMYIFCLCMSAAICEWRDVVHIYPYACMYGGTPGPLVHELKWKKTTSMKEVYTAYRKVAIVGNETHDALAKSQSMECTLCVCAKQTMTTTKRDRETRKTHTHA